MQSDADEQKSSTQNGPSKKPLDDSANLHDLGPLAASDPAASHGNSSNGSSFTRPVPTPQTGPRHRYVRIKPSEPSEPISETPPEPISVDVEKIPSNAPPFQKVSRFLFGKPIPTEEYLNEQIGRFMALALLSSDALSSVAYGTEASLAVLVAAGTGALNINLTLGALVVALLAIVVFSYRQTIFHYPNGGGSYIVARENLNVNLGLIAAGALLIDYIMTVSVSVSSGVDALVAALPRLQPFGVLVGVVLISIMVLINLRGVRESGNIFAAPTYIFVASFLLMLFIGLFHAVTQGGLLHPLPPNPTGFLLPGHTVEHLSAFLILTAFASGCSAMTGVEAISNGVPIFKSPQSRNAAQTMMTMAILLAIMYGGTTYLAWRFGITPQPNSYPPVIAQLGHLFFTGWFSWFFYVFQFATTMILVLAANTSFSGFPRLASILARDNFLPHIFSAQGDKLAFNTGIIVLAVLAMVMLIVFNGNTDALINLYALGVFTAFTLSQAGMVRMWLRTKERGWLHGLMINGIGSLTTLIVTGIIAVAKFDRGAWVVVIMIPVLFFMFKGIYHHYQIAQTLVAKIPVRAVDGVPARHIVVVPIAHVDNLALRGLAYAHSISPYVLAINVSMSPDERAAVQKEWANALKEKKNRYLLHGASPFMDMSDDAGDDDFLGKPQGLVLQLRDKDKPLLQIKGNDLIIIDSKYRTLTRPILDFVDALREQLENDIITVVLPEFVAAHFWEALLHNQTVLRLKLALLRRPGIVTANVPYRLENHKKEAVVVPPSEAAIK